MQVSTLPKKLAWRALSLVPQRLREGTSYRSWRTFLHQSAHWHPEQIEAWQAERLRETVRFAIENTEAYREMYRKAGVKPQDIRRTADLKHLPFTTKYMLQNDLEGFSIQASGRKYRTTGGTTGQPVGLYQTPGMLAVERAFIHDAWSGFGWTPGAPMAVLRGSYIGTRKQPWQWDPYRRELQLSSYYLTRETLPMYADAVSRYGTTIMQAFPSALHVFADLVRETGMAARFPFRGIFLASENFYSWQIEKTAQVFPNATLFDFYGLTERVIFAAWCPQFRSYHANPFYGVTELSDGELIGTSFHNRGTPFIRYRTMDHAEAGALHCTGCHRNWQLLPKLLGRLQEQMVTGTGRYISMSAMNMHDRIFDPLIQYQFMQQKAGEVSFLYVPREPLTLTVENKIRQGMMAKLGSDVVLTMQPVAEIPRTKAGKTRLLDQRIPLRYGEGESSHAA
jgi:phenylacetate-CoA ligase